MTMSGNKRSGNRGPRRGRPLRRSFTLPHEVALSFRLWCWATYGRPATPEEEQQEIARIVRAAIAPAPAPKA
jgi:hypothetical protein